MEENLDHTKMNEGDINLIDLLIVLAKHKGMIAGVTVGAAILMMVVCMMIPPVYRAETKIFIPHTNTTSFSAQMIDHVTPIATFMGGSNQVGIDNTKNNLYVEMLKSRPIQDRIIDRFDLKKGNESKTREELQEYLLEKTLVKADAKSGIIILGIEDRSPQKAADMANAFIDEFRKQGKEYALAEASERRLLFEEQLHEARDAVSKAEAAMRAFQEKTRVVKPDVQGGAVMEAISQLRAQIALKEVEIKGMCSSAASENSDIQRAEDDLRGMRENLRILETKSPGYSKMASTGHLSSADIEYEKLLQDLKDAGALYNLLQEQSQSATLDHARDAMLVQVIEKASPPLKKKEPRTMIMVVLAVITGFIVSIIVAFIIDFKERASLDPRNRERIETLKKNLSLVRR